MGRRSSGGNYTSPPHNRKSPPPAIRAARHRNARAASEPPKPSPPQRIVSTRRVTPTTTYAEVTRGTSPALTEVTTPARGTRAASLPPEPRRITRFSTNKATSGGATTTSAPPPTTTMTSCSASVTLTTTTTTTSTCGRPIPSPAVATTPPAMGVPWSLSPIATPPTSSGSQVGVPTIQTPPRVEQEEDRSQGRATLRGRVSPPPPALPSIEESSSETGDVTEGRASEGELDTGNASTRKRKRSRRKRRGSLRSPTTTPTPGAEAAAATGQPPQQEGEVQEEILAAEGGGSTAEAERGPRSINSENIRATSPIRINDSDRAGSGKNNNNKNNNQYICSRCGAHERADTRNNRATPDGGRRAATEEAPRTPRRNPDTAAPRRGTRRHPQVTGGRNAPQQSTAGPRRGPPSHPQANEHRGGARNPPRNVQRLYGNSRGNQRGETPGLARPEGPSQGPRAAANADRARLVALAEAVETAEQLEELAAKVATFFSCRSVVGSARTAESAASGRGGRPRTDARAEGEHPQARTTNSRETAGPVTRSEYVREATRLQRLFRANRKKAVREVLQGGSQNCQVPKENIFGHFSSIFAERSRPEPLPALHFEDPLPGTNDTLVAPFTQAEVSRRLRRMKNSAPGPDGLAYGDLRKGDPGAVLLTAVFNSCRRMERIPNGWKDSNTVLIYKKGDRDDLSNWRPLAMGDVTPKLFAAVLADRLTRWAVNNNRLSKAQKGFLPYEGCLEHNFVLQETLAEARRRKKELVVAWLDLSNAFGSVPHATILGALTNAGAPGSLVKIVGDLYTNCATRVLTADGPTEKIPMLSGVRQGCPLSPILFNLALEPVVRGAADSGEGLEVAGEKVTVLAYADDLAFVASSPRSMATLLHAAEETARALGLSFNPRKCASLHTKGSGGVVRTEFILEGEPIPALGEGEPYEHLGIPTGAQVDQNPYSTIQGVMNDLCAVDRSPLAPWQKVETVATFLLPRLDFVMRGTQIRKLSLAEADKAIKRAAKAWLNLPQRASPEVVFIPPSWGGCGLLPLADLADVTIVAHAFRMLNAGDPIVARIARTTLETAARERLRRQPTSEDLARYLSGSLEGDLARPSSGRSSFWARVRAAATRSGGRLGFSWRWDDGKRELSVVCLSRKGRTVVVTPAAKGQVIRRLRASVSECHMASLLRKRDQGKVYDATSCHGMSNHFMRTGAFVRFADWRFVHRARLDVLPLNGARRWGAGDRRCRRCGYEAETLPHVLSHCGPHSAARQLRHHSLVQRLARAIRLPGELRTDRRVQGVDDDLAALRPDIVVTHELSKTVVIVDVAVPFENTLAAIEEARVGKVRKYQPLADSLRRRGYRVCVDAFVVGALGAWDPGNEALLATLRVSPRYAALMRRLMVSETIAWSRDIYVEHVSGVRQYSVTDARTEAAPEEAVPGNRRDVNVEVSENTRSVAPY